MMQSKEMRPRLNFKVFLFCLFLFFSLFGFSQSEEVQAFDAEIEILESGEIIVTERIKIYATGNVFKRGIYRNLPIRKEDEYGRTIRNDYTILSVTRGGERSKYHTDRKGNDLFIYVGESDYFINTGIHEYTIQYKIDGQLRFFDDYDELYWNVNGFEWSVPVRTISSTIILPKDAEHIQSACYTGRRGSTERDCVGSTMEDKIRFEYKNNGIGNNMTVAVGFTKGIVTPPPPPKPPTFLERFGAQLMTIIVGSLLFFYYFFTWRKFGIDPPKPTVIPQFNIPENLSPASIGMIKKGYYWPQLITSSFVNLGVKGYLQINDYNNSKFFKLIQEKGFEIVKLKEPDYQLPKEELFLMKQLFSGKATKLTISGKYDSVMASIVKAYRSNISQQWRKLINQGNNVGFLVFPILFAMAYIFFFFMLSPYFKTQNLGAYLLGFIVINAILFLFYQWLIRKPSLRKLELRSLIEGFNMYLNAAEEKQIQSFNPPELTPEIFEKYLPYAMVLGSDKIWGKQFQRLINQSSEYKDYSPTWTNRSSMNMSSFGQSLNQSFTNSLKSTSTAPSSSGSGGGGFSGGGGGGGGGGGW